MRDIDGDMSLQASFDVNIFPKTKLYVGSLHTVGFTLKIKACKIVWDRPIILVFGKMSTPNGDPT